MPPRKPGKAAEFRSLLETRQFERIGEAEWDVIAKELAPISDRTLRHLVRRCGIPVDVLVEGVRLDTFADLERTLLALSAEYEQARNHGDRQKERTIRRLAITAKDHARMASRRASDPGRRADKAEMSEWLVVWLENPAVFGPWAALRRRAKEAG